MPFQYGKSKKAPVMVKAGAATAESLQQLQLKNKPPSERGLPTETLMWKQPSQVDDKCPRGFHSLGEPALPGLIKAYLTWRMKLCDCVFFLQEPSGHASPLTGVNGRPHRKLSQERNIGASVNGGFAG